MSTCSSSLLSAFMLAVPAQRMDPQLRKLLEVAYEAWIDSGINHLALRGSERVKALLAQLPHEVTICLQP